MTYAMKNIFQIIVLFLTFTLLSCTQKIESSVPKKHTRLVDIYVELYILQNQSILSDSMYADSAEIILNRFGFTQDEYQKALTYFNDKPERWELFYKEVLDKLQEKIPPKENPSNQ